MMAQLWNILNLFQFLILVTIMSHELNNQVSDDLMRLIRYRNSPTNHKILPALIRHSLLAGMSPPHRNTASGLPKILPRYRALTHRSIGPDKNPSPGMKVSWQVFMRVGNHHTPTSPPPSHQHTPPAPPSPSPPPLASPSMQLSTSELWWLVE